MLQWRTKSRTLELRGVGKGARCLTIVKGRVASVAWGTWRTQGSLPTLTAFLTNFDRTQHPSKVVTVLPARVLVSPAPCSTPEQLEISSVVPLSL